MLTEIQIKRARPRERAYKLGDAGWLYLLVTPSGGKLWRQNYRYKGKTKTLALGKYPEITLAEARALAAANRVKLAHGEDPAPCRHTAKITIGALALEWYEGRAAKWTAGTRSAIKSRIDRHILPALGPRNPSDVTAADIEAAVTAIAEKSPVQAAAVLSIYASVFDAAIRRGITRDNPARALRGVIVIPAKTHHAAIIEPEAFGAFLRALDTGEISEIARWMLQFLILVFTRPSNVREAEWAEIDAARGVWTIPAAKTKTSEDYIVPLSRQALEILEEIRPLTGKRRYVFSLAHDKPIAKNTPQNAITAIGYKSTVTMHGFRATARTMLHEQLRFPPDAIEAQLGHTVPDRLGRAYNRTRHLDVRREMMQAWADYLDRLRADAKKTQ